MKLITSETMNSIMIGYFISYCTSVSTVCVSQLYRRTKPFGLGIVLAKSLHIIIIII